VKNVVPNACRRAGLAKRLTTHGLRHTYASHLVMRRTPVTTVRELLGHADLTMVARYTHLSPEVARAAVQVLDAPASQGS
jgi:site-specific recombinase XerD